MHHDEHHVEHRGDIRVTKRLSDGNYGFEEIMLTASVALDRSGNELVEELALLAASAQQQITYVFRDSHSEVIRTAALTREEQRHQAEVERAQEALDTAVSRYCTGRFDLQEAERAELARVEAGEAADYEQRQATHLSARSAENAVQLDRAVQRAASLGLDTQQAQRQADNWQTYEPSPF